MRGYISTNVYTIPNIGVRTEMQIDLLQGNQHVNSCPNSRSYCLGSKKERRIKSRRRIIKMFSRRKYLRRKKSTLMMLNADVKSADQRLGL